MNPTLPLILTVPHSGELIPKEASWLQGVDCKVLKTDIDRFVDELYAPAAKALGLPCLVFKYHRYALDLNRTPKDIDPTIVEGSAQNPEAGRFTSLFHWRATTLGSTLLSKPILLETHDALVRNYYAPFHRSIETAQADILKQFAQHPHFKGVRYHLDLHSMPSKATAAHKDVGGTRPDIVVSDCEGKASGTEFKDLVIESLSELGFSINYNWPYKGGRMTEHYGAPQQNRHSLQIEINRALYMEEAGERNKKPEAFTKLQRRLTAFLESVAKKLQNPSNN